MKKALILVIILLFSELVVFSQNQSEELQKKDDLYILKREAEIKRRNKWARGDFAKAFHIKEKKPFIWDWIGYKKPIYVDSLVCKDNKLINWTNENVRKSYDTLTLIQKENIIPVIRIDSVKNRIFLCCGLYFCVDYMDTRYTIYDFIKNFGNRDSDFACLEGYWKYDNNCFFIIGNAVELFFNRFEKQRMGSPLIKHKSILYDCPDSHSYILSPSKSYWIYDNEITEYLFKDEKGEICYYSFGILWNDDFINMLKIQ